MKYRVTSNRHPFDKGTEFKFDDSIKGIEFSTAFDELPRIGNGYLNKYPNDFEPVEQLKEGDYIVIHEGKSSEVVGRVNSVDDDPNWPIEVKFISGGFGSWENDDSIRKLSHDEIEQALIEEAKRRGFESAKKWKPAYDTPVDFWMPCDGLDSFDYDKDVDKLYYADTCVYARGSWAEIVEGSIQINDKAITVEDGTVKIGCGDTIEEEMFKNFYAVVNKYNLDVSRNGEQVNEQLKQIWDKMPKWHSGKTAEWTIEVSDDDIFKANSCGRMKL